MGMQFIKHRVNQIAQLRSVDKRWGVEIDLRADSRREGELVLQHDPWKQGDDFSIWLQEFSKRGINGPVVLNVKEDGLEDRIIELCKGAGVQNYFFLDTQLPTLVKRHFTKGETHFCARNSLFEPLDHCQKMAPLCDWVWVDFLRGRVPPEEEVTELQKSFRVCLVSPELVTGKFVHSAEFIKLGQKADAICTKDPDLWQSLL